MLKNNKLSFIKDVDSISILIVLFIYYCLKGTVSLIEQENLTYGLVQVIFKYIDIDWIIKIEEN